MPLDREQQWLANHLPDEAGQAPDSVESEVDARFREMVRVIHEREMRVLEGDPRYEAAKQRTIAFLLRQGRALQLLALGDVSGVRACAEEAEARGKWSLAAGFYEQAGDAAKHAEILARLEEQRIDEVEGRTSKS